MIGWDILWKAIRNIAHGQVFDENFLMCIASIGAMVIGEYDEGGAVMILYQIGELFQSVAVGKSRRSIAEMVDINPEYANVERDGEAVSTRTVCSKSRYRAPTPTPQLRVSWNWSRTPPRTRQSPRTSLRNSRRCILLSWCSRLSRWR